MSQVDAYPVDHWPAERFHPLYDTFREWLDDVAPAADPRLNDRPHSHRRDNRPRTRRPA